MMKAQRIQSEFHTLGRARRSILCLMAITFLLAICGWNQDAVAAERNEDFLGVRRNTATVIFCGLGGAVLGLSTLSFYGKPADHTGNIYAGLAIGMVAGLTYVLTRENGDPGFANKSEEVPWSAEFERRRGGSGEGFELTTRPGKKTPPVLTAVAWSWSF